MQVAGSQLRNPPVKFRQERRLHIWRSISIQHVQMEAGLNSDPGNDSFWDKIRDAKHVDRSGIWYLVFGINFIIILSRWQQLANKRDIGYSLVQCHVGRRW